MAHEIRNPLTAIKARLFTQQKALRPASPEFQDALVIGGEIDRLERIVKSVLEFARPAEPRLVRLSAANILNEIGGLFGQQMRQAGIELRVEPAPNATLRADPEQLKQVLINLIRNAAESIGAGWPDHSCEGAPPLRPGCALASSSRRWSWKLRTPARA